MEKTAHWTHLPLMINLYQNLYHDNIITPLFFQLKFANCTKTLSPQDPNKAFYKRHLSAKKKTIFRLVLISFNMLCRIK